MLNDTHFEILGVTRYSTKEEIKKGYRDQMKKWHPDRFFNEPDKITEALERSKKINEAFCYLENYQPTAKTYSTSQSATSRFNKAKEQSAYNRTSSKNKASRIDIEHIRVKSSNIYSVGYDLAKRILQVRFTNGSFYQYCEVPNFVYNELMQATSKGKYFNSKIAFCYKYDCV